MIVRCEFVKAPRKWKKYPKKHYWKVSISWALRWEPLRVYKIKHPSRKKLVKWNWKARDLKIAIRKKASAVFFLKWR